MTVIGNDVCSIDGLRISEAERAELAEAGPCGKFLAESMGVFLEICAEDDGYAQLCDPAAMASLIWSDFVTESKECQGQTINHDCAAKGEVLFYVKGVLYEVARDSDNYPIDVVTNLNAAFYLKSVCALVE